VTDTGPRVVDDPEAGRFELLVDGEVAAARVAVLPLTEPRRGTGR
jgi:hypothetical protein